MEWWTWMIAYVVGCIVACGICGMFGIEAETSMLITVIWPLVVLFWAVVGAFYAVIYPFSYIHKFGMRIAAKKAERKRVINRFKSIFWKLDLDEE